MKVTAQKLGLLNCASGIALAILAIVAIWHFSLVSPSKLALLAVAVLFFICMRRPVWAMAGLLVSEFDNGAFIRQREYVAKNLGCIPVSCFYCNKMGGQLSLIPKFRDFRKGMAGLLNTILQLEIVRGRERRTCAR
jgi:hypothetical protein